MIKVTRKQYDTLIAVRDRARTAKANGVGTVEISEAEFQLAKRKLQQVVDSGVELQPEILATAKRMGLIK